MQSKKYILLFALFLLVAGGTYAQLSTSGYDVYDTSVISRKSMPQQVEFWNNRYNFPAKPRNQWEVGVSGGMFFLSSDVPSVLPTFGFSAHVRKSLGYMFSMRLQYMNGTAKGLNWNASRNYGNNSAWNSLYNAPTSFLDPVSGNVKATSTIPGRGLTDLDVVFYNYRNRTEDLTLQGLISFNNIKFHKNKSSVVFYLGAGLGVSAYETKINAKNEATGDTYANLFNDLFKNTAYLYSNRRDILKELKAEMDDTYETAAQKNGTGGQRRLRMGNKTIRPVATAIAGMEIKLSKRINLAIEDRHTFSGDDLMDGQQWQEHAFGAPVLTGNWDTYNYLSVGLNFNLGEKSTEPLWWLNPLDYAYGELNNPRHMKLPKPALDDTDGDGVIDILDREPNTPAGAAVDTHGVSRDTDGDGVPDYKDKQLVTPTECQPVDADGVGKCPEPECCKNVKASTERTGDCPTDFPSVSFKGNASTLAADSKALLSSVAAKLKANPSCNITINGYPEASKASQAVSQKRLEAVKLYLVQTEGISAERISTNNEIGGGDKNTVDIKSTY